MVAQIKYRINKVLDSGKTPQHEVTVQERLRQAVQHKNENLQQEKRTGMYDLTAEPAIIHREGWFSLWN